MIQVPKSLHNYMAGVINSLCRVCQGVKVNNASGVCRACRTRKCSHPGCNATFGFQDIAKAEASTLCQRHRAMRKKKADRYHE